MDDDAVHEFHRFHGETLRDVTWSPLALLAAIAQSDGAINPKEQVVLREYVKAARHFHHLHAACVDEECLVQEAVDRKMNGKLVSKAARAVVISECCRQLFPSFFAWIAVADGLPNVKEKTAILGIRTAVREAAKR